MSVLTPQEGRRQPGLLPEPSTAGVVSFLRQRLGCWGEMPWGRRGQWLFPLTPIEPHLERNSGKWSRVPYSMQWQTGKIDLLLIRQRSQSAMILQMLLGSQCEPSRFSNSTRSVSGWTWGFFKCLCYHGFPLSLTCLRYVFKDSPPLSHLPLIFLFVVAGC